MVTAAEKFIFSGGGEPYLTMITEYEGGTTTFNYNGNVQPGDLVIVCASGTSTFTPTNATLAVEAVDGSARAAVYYRIAQSETSITISGASDVSGYVIRNEYGPLNSASVFATNTQTDGDITIGTATNVAGTVRAVAVYAANTAKYVLNGVNIGVSRNETRDTLLGYETTVAERIFGANDNDLLQDCCSIDPQSGTGSLRLDSESSSAAAAAVLTVI